MVDPPKPKESATGAESSGYVPFEPFVGVAPRQYMDVFTMVERKNKLGDVVTVKKATSKPLFAKDLPPDLVLLVKEDQEFNRFKEHMSAKMASESIPQKNPQGDVVQMKKPEAQNGA